MVSAAADYTTLSFSTNDVPERDRLAYWREFFVRKVVLAEYQPLSDRPLQAAATLYSWPGLRAARIEMSTSAVLKRTPAMIADGDDAFCILMKRSGRLNFAQRGKELSLGKGDAVGILHDEPAAMAVSQTHQFALVVPRCALAPLVRNVEDAAMRLIVEDNEALRLLRKYSGILSEDIVSMSPELRHVAVTHIYDLIGMALGATRDGAAMANGRGVRAARLRAIKADILENLGDSNLTVTEVSLRQRVTPRYIHMVFETEGITFSEFVVGQRLTRAHHMLSDPRFAALSISMIAYEAGFGDLSYFNRSFRRRFGASPSEMRRRFRRSELSDTLGNLP